MNLGIVGAGYVGLVAAACFAESGNDVVCGDIDERKISALKRGEIPIYEPGLDRLVSHNAAAGRLSFTTDVAETVREADVVFIAVGTPQDEDGSADLKYVLAVAETIGKSIKGPTIVVNKSTVPVGTADLVRQEISKHTNETFHVVSNPEFLKEGSAVDDFMKPDRVVIGAADEQAAEVMKELYSPFVRTGKPILLMDNRSAELSKYAANALLATRITFMNEIANLCERVGADVANVRRGVGSDSRIGPSFLFSGVGYGGSCFPKDVRALTRTAKEQGLDLEIVTSVDKVNNAQKSVLSQKIIRHFGSPDAVRGKTFALWGLSFKPRTDDMREAPSLTLIRELDALGASVRAYDPEAMNVARGIFEGKDTRIEFCSSSYDALKGAEALCIVTEWNEFRRPNLTRVKEALGAPVVFDGRNLFEPQTMERHGFTYYSIGRSPVGV